MPYPNEHSARLKEPSQFKEKPDWAEGGGKFRRVADGKIYGKIKVPNTAFVIWGQLKNQSGKESAPQAIRFPTKDWTADKAKKWLRDNKVKYIKFEPASKKKDKDNSAITEPTTNELKIIEHNYLGFIDRAREYAAKNRIGITEALKAVKRKEPRLYEFYLEQLS